MLNSFFHVIVLSVIQAVTEFLPISSSGHLVVFENWFHFKHQFIEFNLVLHLGTLTAVIIFYWNSLMKIFSSIYKSMLHKTLISRDEYYHHFPLWIISSLLGTFFIFFFFKRVIMDSHRHLYYIGMALILNGILLYLTRFLAKERTTWKTLTIFTTFLIGIFQGLAIIPGISRSGATITVALIMGISSLKAMEYSFILSIPTIIIATLSRIRAFSSISTNEWSVYLIGFAICVIIGFFTLNLLKKMVRLRKFHYFSYYCWLFGIIVLLIAIIKYE